MHKTLVMQIQGLIGRENELHTLAQVMQRDDAQLVAVYGRRRVGKTFLVKRFFNETYDFSFVGSYKTQTSIQLELFRGTLERYSGKKVAKLKTWYEAFNALRDYLQTLNKERIVIFLDELPWMDQPKSNFLSAFSFFWNDWACSVKGLKLVACGSATTWMLDKFVGDKGGFYGRNNRAIYLPPFTLNEVEQFLKMRGFVWSRHKMVEAYMVFGGIPYYLDMLDSTIPLEANIDSLFFRQGTQLRGEYLFLFRTLFNEAPLYHRVVECLADNEQGMTQAEIKEKLRLKDGGTLTTCLENLQKCDFIRMYAGYKKKERETLYQLTDLFTLFHLNFIRRDNGQDEHYWTNLNDHSRENWEGHAFEMVCLHHIPEIKQRLGIFGVLTNAYSWTTKAREDKDGSRWKKAQIDLLLERADGHINVCEMKFSKNEYRITEAYDARLRERMNTFIHHTGTKATLQSTFITTYGLVRNEYAGNVQSQVTLDDLFCVVPR